MGGAAAPPYQELKGKIMSADAEQPTPAMDEQQFTTLLNQLVTCALQSGISFGAIVHTLEFAKSDVIEMCRQQVRQEEEARRPRILLPD
jgi:hypothetical protein